MIKMIAGIYGYRTKDGTVEAKTVKSAPFSCAAEEEARLVGLRVAEYVQEDDEDDGGENAEKPLESMTKKELTDEAAALGVVLPKKATNQQIIELIKAARAEHEGQDDGGDGDDDGEDAPNPGAAMPE